MLKILSMLSMVILASSLGLSAPAHAKIVYTFTSSQGDFVYISPSYKSSGILGRVDEFDQAKAGGEADD
jgi:hypothetical protein